MHFLITIIYFFLLNSLFLFLPTLCLCLFLALFCSYSLLLCSLILKCLFILHAWSSENAMRFSLRNSRVQISFLCLRSLLVLLLRLSNTTILSTPRHDNSFKKSLRRVEYLLPEYTLVIHASTSTHFSWFDFLLLREEIDRVSSPPSNSRSSRSSTLRFLITSIVAGWLSCQQELANASCNHAIVT